MRENAEELNNFGNGNSKEDLNLTEDDTVMKKYKIAAILMIIHGGFMELGGIFAMIPALLIGTDKYDIGQYFEFKLPYFQDNSLGYNQ